MSKAVCDATACELADKFAAGTVSPVDVLEACLARIERLNPKLNAIVTLDSTGARTSAAQSAARWRAGKPLSALDGVPITIKDNLFVAGMRATWGSRLFEEQVPQADEQPVARLRAAGLVMVGKTNVPEFTLQGYTDNLLFGPTRNPWNAALTPGGSSGGAVASVASGMVPVAIGTDGGGSIRRPASHTGLVGLKPTTGRVPRSGGFPAILHDFEVVGPIGQTVADVSALMAVLAGPDQRDPLSSPWPAWREPRAETERLRILYIPTFGASPVDPEIHSSVADAADALRRLGHDVEPGDVPFDYERVAEAFGTVATAGLVWLLRDHQWAGRIGPGMQAMADAGVKLTVADYAEALAVAHHLKVLLAELFSRFDMLLTPAAAALPWPADQSHPPTIAGQHAGPRGHAVFTAFANVAGCPGLALPCSPSRAGLPIGLQLVARPGADEKLIGLAKCYEVARPWRERRPLLDAACSTAQS
jgi:aspartyl-tRNA(Asn)/glutamyl-tRNA(Gln) amidotransferase subunit A